ncbi:MAG: hypothetical protein AAF442_03155 [Pseudomonadota bacterium]
MIGLIGRVVFIFVFLFAAAAMIALGLVLAIPLLILSLIGRFISLPFFLRHAQRYARPDTVYRSFSQAFTSRGFHPRARKRGAQSSQQAPQQAPRPGAPLIIDAQWEEVPPEEASKKERKKGRKDGDKPSSLDLG